MEKTLTKVECPQIILQERCGRLLEWYAPNNLPILFADVRKVTDCLALQDNGEPTLARISRQSDMAKTQMKAVLKLNLIDLDNFLHLRNPLTESEVDFVATEVLEDFGHGLTMADVLLVMKTAKKGGYGKFYERLSAPDIIQWFANYFNKRIDASEKYSRQKDMEKYGYSDGSERRRERTSEPQQLGGYMVWKAQYLEDGTI